MSLSASDVELLEVLFVEGSTAGAAARLGVEQSTVSRRLAGLETRLGRELFVRGPRGLIPTPLAERLRPIVDQAGSAFRVAERLLQEEREEPTGLVRIALPEAFAQYILCPRIPAFLARHPALELAFDDGPELVDLKRAEAHIAVRVPRPVSGDLVVKRYLRDTIGLYGHPTYVAGRTLDDLTLITWDHSHAHLPEAKLGEALPHEGPKVRFRRLSTMVEAARHGVGAVWIGRRLAREVGLVAVEDPRVPAVQTELWLAAPSVLRQSPAVSAVWDWLVSIADAADESSTEDSSE
ncbi:MAG: LysR family transcriptional regulator [Myxococcota bacterium]|nr:LysR family transcriptional regulator [Myxococcota bacterium]